MKRILFIGHDASLTGAPFVLLHLLRWLKQNTPEYSFELLLLNDGELEDEFRQVCSVHVVRRRRSGSIVRRGFQKLRQEFDIRFGTRRRLLSDLAAKHQVVVGNTVVTLSQLKFFKQRGASTLCWVHELDYVVSRYYSEKEFSKLIRFIDAFVVGSKAVRSMLVRRGIKQSVEVVYEFSAAMPAMAGADIRSELRIPTNAFVVGACATIEWRKGTDLYFQIAKRLVEKTPDIYCIWVGGRFPGTEIFYDEIQSDIRRLGLEDRIIFVDPRHDLSEYYRVMNVFLLPSREDPFPLVCLEAASLAKPIICFENAGGMPEFVESDCGFVVPYLDVEAAAEKIGDLYTDPRLTETMGNAAAEKMRRRHDINILVPKILEEIEKLRVG